MPPAGVLGAGVVTAGAIFWLLGRRMAARTAEGSAVLAQSLGFRQYLVTAEANQIRWEEAQDDLQPLPALRHRLRRRREVG